MARVHRPSSDDWRAFARVVIAAIGVVVAYWNALNLAPGHPYRHALAMIDSYLRRTYLDGEE